MGYARSLRTAYRSGRHYHTRAQGEVSLTYSGDTPMSVRQRVGKIKVKKKCCRSDPRCKRCPVTVMLKERKKALKKAAKAEKKAKKAAKKAA
ncbi:hypothetical protein DFJ66_3940 [Saccharothrix variisporea]|uniref:Uncharacterized protein n=2 Tax=Saccharothrix variisporea TaxID=543527 RepID=A0A495X8Y7_9PSEU|nr:hypothetical protein DFJ66_3940 [Saccharothrix variisporea]